jgi:uncharacterized membrane protein
MFVLLGNLALVVLLGSKDLLLFSPVFVSIIFLFIFASSLWGEISLIERFAAMFDPDLPEEARSYCRKVTVIWCCFFVVNATIAAWTAVFATLEIWALYNGFIAYLLVGVLLLGEYLVRHWIKGKLSRPLE